VVQEGVSARRGEGAKGIEGRGETFVGRNRREGEEGRGWHASGGGG
jgi:hypothetical protein